MFSHLPRGSKRIALLLPVVLLLGLLSYQPLGADESATALRTVSNAVATEGGTSVFFSPLGHCTDAIVEQLSQAKQRVDVQAYYLTSAPIAKALLDAKKRGVVVRVILDKSQRSSQYSEADFLANQGIATFIDPVHTIAHNKIVIIDEQVILTGSFNFTKAAEETNAENLLVIQGRPALAAAYEKNFAQHLAHSEPYVGRGTPPAGGSPPPGNPPTPPAGSPVAPGQPPPAPAPAPGGEKPPGGAPGANQPPDAQDNLVYVTRTGTHYHREGCSYLRAGATPLKLSEAKARGLEPCSRCKPPQ